MYMQMAKNDVSEEKDKPAFDEQTLAKLLEAAYVLQEHNRELQKMERNLELQREQFVEPAGVEPQQVSQPLKQSGGAPKEDYTTTLAQIVETQRQIQVRRLQSRDAMSLVAERVIAIARAQGAGIGILEGKNVDYRAGVGVTALPSGSNVPMEKALCVATLRTGQVIRCADVNPEFLLDAEECQRRGIQSLIVVPVYHDGGIGGALELYYANTQAFTEEDVHTCQLMAGLVTEALARDEEDTMKKSLASERAVMLDALEKIKPNLAALVAGPARASSQTSAPTFVCRKCGHQLVGEEQFCGKCGSPRSSDYGPSDMQSKVASLWHMQEARKNVRPSEDDLAHSAHLAPAKPLEETAAVAFEGQVPELFSSPDVRREIQASDEKDHDRLLAGVENSATELTIDLKADEEAEVESPNATALTAPQRPAAWSSAAAARDFLEQLAPNRQDALTRFLQARRGNIYLAVAVGFVACILGWGIWSNHSVGATGNPASSAAHRKPAPDADLSWYESMMIRLGLAEAPEPPESKGNPEIQVWVDIPTALYYCPGADLYGKTQNGKFTTQRDAQLDQFEAASRKACN